MNGSLPRGLPAEAGFTGVSIDSRRIREGDLFIAVRGEKHDGHDFIKEALESGAVAAVVEQRWLSRQKRRAVRGLSLIPVSNTIEALQALAHYHRHRLGLPVIAITGSNGKTTTKEMTAAILGTRFRILRSESSLNNHIGVPLTLLRLRQTHEIAVIEVGMNHEGEIAKLCWIAEPTAGVVTNVGSAHLEYLGDLEAVARAKRELVEAISPHGFVVLNADDTRVAAMGEDTDARKITFGFGDDAEVRGEIIEFTGGIYPVFRYNNGSPIRLWVPGRHNIANALAAAATAEAMGCSQENVRDGLESFRGTRWRTEVIKLGEFVILNDAYNSNPVSATAALELLHNWENSPTPRRVAVLGDMLELGDTAPQLHKSLGRRAFESGVELLIAVGDYANDMAQGAHDAGMSLDRIVESGNVDEAWRALNSRVEPGDLVLLKASRRVGLERLVDLFRAGESNRDGAEGDE